MQYSGHTEFSEGAFFLPSDALIILATLLAGLNELGTPLTRNLVDRFFLYLPHLLASLLVLIGGALVSRFLSRSVLIAAVNAQMP